MQATLLGLAIAMILALVTALVGPHFVDWSRYRAEFEAQASRMTGLDVKVAGPIDVRLLPTPTLVLQQVEISRPGDASAMRAQKLGLELALNSLVRGEVRANDVLLEGPDVLISLDKDGRVDWPAPAVTFDADAVSIQQLDIVDGRAVLSDAASGSRLVLDKFEFKGEVRSLAGAIKGEGSFYVAGQHYPYRINASRMGEDKGLRVRLNVDPIDRPVAADVEATVWTEGRIPHFEGSLQLARPVGRAAAGAPDLITEPWRVTTKIKGDSAAAVLEQVEFQYGPDDRAIKLHGDARLNFGATPQIEGVLSSPQVDLDRVLALPEATRRRPLVATRTFADYLTSAHLPLPVKLGISVENLVLAGATLQRVSGDIRSDADSVDVQSLDFRAPGATQVRLSGRLNVTPHGVAFAGPAKVESRDTRALVAWLTDRSDAQGIAGGSLRAEGDVNFGSEAIAVERLKADVDRMAIEGRLAYAWPSGDRPARLEAALNAAEIDLDRAAALARGIFADTEFQWPGEGKLALKVDKASIAGVEAQRADVNLSFDQRGIDIQRLAIGDFGGTAISAKGGIDSRTLTPRGTITVDLDARGFDGLATVMEKFSPPAAEQIRRAAKKFVPAKLQLSLALDPNAARTAGTPVGAKLKVDGTAGAFQVSLQTDAGLVSDALAPGNLPKLATVETNLSGRLEAADATALVALIGLDGLLSVDKGRPGHISLTANGPLDGRLAVDGQIAGARPRCRRERNASARRRPGCERQPRSQGGECECADLAADAADDLDRAAGAGGQRRDLERAGGQSCRHRHRRTADHRPHPAGRDRRRHQARIGGPAGRRRQRDRRSREGRQCGRGLAIRSVRAGTAGDRARPDQGELGTRRADAQARRAGCPRRAHDRFRHRVFRGSRWLHRRREGPRRAAVPARRRGVDLACVDPHRGR